LSGFEEMTNALTSGRSEQTLGSNADPKFPEWDGSPHTIHSWINNATHLVELHGTVDQKGKSVCPNKISAIPAEFLPPGRPTTHLEGIYQMAAAKVFALPS
jgi:hypothetical protein